MYLQIVLAVLIVAVAAQFQEFDQDIKTFQTEHDGSGNYQTNVETADGTKLAYQGSLKPNPNPSREADSASEIQAVQGSYSWVDTDGQSHTVNFVADENGYRAEGADVPKPQQ